MKYLQSILRKIDGKGYKAYKDIRGKYKGDKFELAIDYVQGDPFASPSKIRFIIPRGLTTVQDSFTNSDMRKIHCEDYIARAISRSIIKNSSQLKGSGKSGLILIDTPGQEILERSSVQITDKSITICLSIGLPAQGRRVLGKQAETVFFTILPAILQDSLFSLKQEDLTKVVQHCDQQQEIRKYLKENNLITFISDGAILPRESGISNKPLKGKNVIPFQSPNTLRVEIPIPHRNEPITGMAIEEGITLVVGGGYHGKSTLLKAIERGVYDHIRGDGREFVITNELALKIRAEDGRGISSVDISPFINNLPHQIDSCMFSSENASGSTSQAANIVEAIESGATSLLIDEDTSATNFMIRDSRMQALVAKEKEPITPFVDKVKQLYQEKGISTIIVMGGSGDYFDIANKVIMMDQYQPIDVTDKAKEISSSFSSLRKQEGGESFGDIRTRIVLNGSLNSYKGNKSKVKVRGKDQIQYGDTEILLHHLEQLVDSSQTRAIGEILQYIERENLLQRHYMFPEIIELIQKKMDKEGLSSFVRYKDQHPGELARPRMLEFAAALNRLRTLRIK